MIESFEGRKHTAYLDSAGRLTIGVGHLIKPNEEHLLTAILSDEQVDELLEQDTVTARKCLENVKVPLKDHQKQALISFIFNVGCGAFKKSTLLKKINSKASDDEIKEQWMRWNKAGGKEIKGLTLRRQQEVVVYLS